MKNLILLKNYKSKLNLLETEIAIKFVKDLFERELATALDLTRVSAPLFVECETGLNDHLNGYERPVSFDVLDEGLSFKPKEEKKREQVEKIKNTKSYVFEDELEEERISNNYEKLLGELFRQLMRKDKITLREYNAILEIKFGKEIYRNGDYYSFLVHLSQKKEYQVDKLMLASETFLEGMVSGMMKQKIGKEYKGLKFTLQFLEEEIVLNGAFKVTDMIFERI